MRVICTGALDLDGYVLGKPTSKFIGRYRAIVTEPGASDRFLKYTNSKMHADANLRDLEGLWKEGNRVCMLCGHVK